MLKAHIEVPAGTRSKDVVCDISTRHIKIGVKVIFVSPFVNLESR